MSDENKTPIVNTMGQMPETYTDGEVILTDPTGQIFTLVKDYELLSMDSLLVRVNSDGFFLVAGEKNPLTPKHTRCRTVLKMQLSLAKSLAEGIKKSVDEYERQRALAQAKRPSVNQ